MDLQALIAVSCITAAFLLIIAALLIAGCVSYRRDSSWIGFDLKTSTFTGRELGRKSGSKLGRGVYTLLAFFAPMKGNFASTFTLSVQTSLRDKMLMVQRQEEWAHQWFPDAAAAAVRYRMLFMERNLKYSKVQVVKRRHLTLTRRKQMFTHVKKLHYSTVLYMPYYSRREQELIKFFVEAETPVEFAKLYSQEYYKYEFAKGHPFTARHLHPSVEEMKQLQQLPFEVAQQLMR